MRWERWGFPNAQLSQLQGSQRVGTLIFPTPTFPTRWDINFLNPNVPNALRWALGPTNALSQPTFPSLLLIKFNL